MGERTWVFNHFNPGYFSLIVGLGRMGMQRIGGEFPALWSPRFGWSAREDTTREVVGCRLQKTAVLGDIDRTFRKVTVYSRFIWFQHKGFIWRITASTTNSTLRITSQVPVDQVGESEGWNWWKKHQMFLWFKSFVWLHDILYQHYKYHEARSRNTSYYTSWELTCSRGKKLISRWIKDIQTSCNIKLKWLQWFLRYQQFVILTSTAFDKRLPQRGAGREAPERCLVQLDGWRWFHGILNYSMSPLTTDILYSDPLEIWNTQILGNIRWQNSGGSVWAQHHAVWIIRPGG